MYFPLDNLVYFKEENERFITFFGWVYFFTGRMFNDDNRRRTIKKL